MAALSLCWPPEFTPRVMLPRTRGKAGIWERRVALPGRCLVSRAVTDTNDPVPPSEPPPMAPGLQGARKDVTCLQLCFITPGPVAPRLRHMWGAAAPISTGGTSPSFPRTWPWPETQGAPGLPWGFQKQMERDVYPRSIGMLGMSGEGEAWRETVLGPRGEDGLAEDNILSLTFSFRLSVDLQEAAGMGQRGHCPLHPVSPEATRPVATSEPGAVASEGGSWKSCLVGAGRGLWKATTFPNSSLCPSPPSSARRGRRPWRRRAACF